MGYLILSISISISTYHKKYQSKSSARYQYQSHYQHHHHLLSVSPSLLFPPFLRSYCIKPLLPFLPSLQCIYPIPIPNSIQSTLLMYPILSNPILASLVLFIRSPPYLQSRLLSFSTFCFLFFLGKRYILCRCYSILC